MSDKADTERSIYHDGDNVLVIGPSPDDTADYYHGLCRRGLGADAATLTATWLQAQIAVIASLQSLSPQVNKNLFDLPEDQIAALLRKEAERHAKRHAHEVWNYRQRGFGVDKND